MLTLARREGQAIWIGANVRIRFIKIRGRTAMVTFEAPPEVQIAREEILHDPVYRNKQFPARLA